MLIQTLASTTLCIQDEPTSDKTAVFESGTFLTRSVRRKTDWALTAFDESFANSSAIGRSFTPKSSTKY